MPSPGKYLPLSHPCSLSFLKGVSNYFETDLSLAKVKIDDKLKSIAFDEKNRRLTVMSYERVIYFIDVPH